MTLDQLNFASSLVLNVLSLVGAAISIFGLGVSIYYLHRNTQQLQGQLQLIVDQDRLNQKDKFLDAWSRFDEATLMHPELIELWLTPKLIAKIYAEFPNEEDRLVYYKRRIGASMIFFAYFRNFQFEEEIKKATGGDNFELDDIGGFHPEMRKLWYEAEIRFDFSRFPAFVETVDSWLEVSKESLKDSISKT